MTFEKELSEISEHMVDLIKKDIYNEQDVKRSIRNLMVRAIMDKELQDEIFRMYTTIKTY